MKKLKIKKLKIKINTKILKISVPYIRECNTCIL